ncbi:MAG: peptidoglycan DD-metalloendopeptidase family protein [Myxococcota bacterium]|nr:peptidoglycan DD-metalloendopeptidase family protein [Myxococcota bacterium]
MAWILGGVLLLALTLGLACTSGSGSGFYHAVEPGENLYRIGRRYGVPTAVIASTNRIRDARNLRVGTKLWIPRRAVNGVSASSKQALRRNSVSEARRLARLDLRRSSNLSFSWPLRAKITSRFGQRGGRLHEGLDLAASRGTPIEAAEAGRVIHSGGLSDYGKAVIIKHEGHYRSVYAHASKTLVKKGQFVEKGQKIALVGTTGRSSGPHLHFEIRKRESPRDPMLYLP